VRIAILCTLGPRSLNRETIAALEAYEVDLFRINLSHTATEEIEDVISLIRRHSRTPICLDTEGPQVRCGRMAEGTRLEPGASVVLTAEEVLGTSARFTLRPAPSIEQLKVGNLLSIDIDGAAVKITTVRRDSATAEVAAAGPVRSNRAVTIRPEPGLPALSEKDLAAVAIGARTGIAHYALSFAGSAKDVERLRSLAPPGAHIIAKIESKSGLRHMDEIIPAADSVLLDRGDLSRQVPIERVPYWQKAVVRRCNRWNRSLYVATNLLESMVTSSTPTVAESNDLANTLLDGVHGLVLASETAVGLDPVGVVAMTRRMIDAFELVTGTPSFADAAELVSVGEEAEPVASGSPQPPVGARSAETE
jgi:sulfate adenylyltransferase